MNRNNELTRDDIAIVDDIEMIDAENGQEIYVYFETHFDVDKKFGTDTSDDDVWLNLYAKYNPFADTLKVNYEIDKPLESEIFVYEPTALEAQLIKKMISKNLQNRYGVTPQEFCRTYSILY